MSSNSFPLLIIAFFLIALGYILDHVDGSLARIRNNRFAGGMFLDYFAHQITVPFMYIAIGYGSTVSLGTIWPLLIGSIIAVLILRPTVITEEHIFIILLSKQVDCNREVINEQFSDSTNIPKGKHSIKNILHEILTFPGLLFYMPIIAIISNILPPTMLFHNDFDLRSLFLICVLVTKCVLEIKKAIAMYRRFCNISAT